MLPRLRRLISGLGLVSSKKAKEEADNVARNLQPLPMLRSLIYPLYYGLNNLIGHAWLWRHRQQGGSIVVLDRYFYEFLIQRRYAKCPDVLVRLMLRLIPRPEVLVYLKVDPRTAYARKPELALEEIERQCEICGKIAEKSKGGMTVDTGLNETSEVVREVQRAIITYITERQRL
jgi:thymidylate kinase